MRICHWDLKHGDKHRFCHYGKFPKAHLKINWNELLGPFIIHSPFILGKSFSINDFFIILTDRKIRILRSNIIESIKCLADAYWQAVSIPQDNLNLAIIKFLNTFNISTYKVTSKLLFQVNFLQCWSCHEMNPPKVFRNLWNCGFNVGKFFHNNMNIHL